MKNIFLSLAVFSMATAMACGIHQFKVPLNQRSFYNPGAICPYCVGSWYFSTGAFAGIHSNDFGMFASIGNDGENNLHGAWDFTYAHAADELSGTSSYSTRYAWKQQVGAWMIATGFRASYTSYSKLFTSGWNCIPEVEVARAKASYYNVDAGFMVTNQKGIYAGFSVLNIPQPEINMSYELLGNQYAYNQQNSRAYTAAAGGLVNLSNNVDLMLDMNASFGGGARCVQPSVIARYKHHLAFGGAITAEKGESVLPEITAGYTSTPFKWLSTVAFSQQGVVIETGVVVRFAVVCRRITRISQPCVSKPIPEEPRTEFSPHQ